MPVALLSVVDDKVAVTPAGRAPRVRVMGELKPFCPTTLTVVVNAQPAVIASDVMFVLRVKPGIPATVSKRLMLWDTEPPAAVMVSLY